MNKKKPDLFIFISHIHEEKDLAQLLKNWIEHSFAGRIDVFVSSDKKNIQLGKNWLNKIDEALLDSTLFIVLLSKNSLRRPWINFESGAAWIKKIDILPVCYSGIDKSNLPKPYDLYQGINIEDINFSEAFFDDISEKLGLKKTPPIDFKKMEFEVKNILNSVVKEKKDELSTSTDETDIAKSPHQILSVEEETILVFIAGFDDTGGANEKHVEKL